ncbi:MAG TPA: DUF4142 domain-containing protein, partial [Cyclobacteriaceae bacterium]|nr:DUF4142 domain-containing protein [Cyclobacteriaceae bacterium]
FFLFPPTGINLFYMKRYALLAATMVLLISCNESRRGNDSNANEDRDEAAAESNTDKFAGDKHKDADFVFEVVESNYGEIKLAELASQKSRNTEVKNIAKMLLTDHTASLNDLKTVAQAKAISVPVEETDAARRTLEDMAGESDKDFDLSWCKKMLDLHETSIDKFEDRLEKTEDAQLKDYVDKTLPVLRKHQEELQACEKKLEQTKS